jgi:hypothetical protein
MKATLRNLTRWASNIGMVSSLIAILVFGTSCSTTMLTDYKPKSDLDSRAAETIIRRALEEQPWEYRPNQILFTDDSLKLIVTRYKINDDFMREPVGTVPIAIYYRSLGKPEVVGRRGRVIVVLRNKYGEALRKVFFPDETEAKQFLDALETLRIRDEAATPKKRE